MKVYEEDYNSECFLYIQTSPFDLFHCLSKFSFLRMLMTQTRDYVNKEIRNESLKLNLLAALYTAMSRRREGLLILDDYNDIINFWKELRDPLFICMILSTIISFLWTLTFFPLHFLAYRKNVLEWRLGKPQFSTKQDVFDANTVKLYFGTTLSFYAFGLVLMSLLLSLMLMLLAWEPGREVLWMLRWWWGPDDCLVGFRYHA